MTSLKLKLLLKGECNWLFCLTNEGDRDQRSNSSLVRQFTSCLSVKVSNGVRERVR